jgi:hypothetical protein
MKVTDARIWGSGVAESQKSGLPLCATSHMWKEFLDLCKGQSFFKKKFEKREKAKVENKG